MSVRGDDDTLAGSMPTMAGGGLPEGTELLAERYQIVRWLGGGGMGRVYEALDTELDERVALKVLRAGLTEDAIERFRREVKLTRRIQHRNVARMYDIGEHRGEKFLTMELVAGESLASEIGPTPMAWPRLKSIAEQICAGLAAAHAAGVIHRDLKPDNVLVERATDRVVITDFGIARSGDDPSVTQVGAIVGTPRYMAPEQLAGRDVDARSDIFALGVMLFELATGTRPWPGDNAVAIAIAQATSAARSIETTAEIPASFVAILAACLHLDPASRPGSASEVGAAITAGSADGLDRDRQATRASRPSAPQIAPRPPAATTGVEPTSLAVLPIACAPGDEYLADGVLDDLTDTLSTTAGLRVRPAGIVRSVVDLDPRELGRQLHVDHVVAGSLRRTTAGLRLATRLIGVADGFQIWAGKVDCTEAEVLTASERMAQGVATALSTRVTGAPRPTDPRAVDLYLRARAELRRFWGNHTVVAADLLEKAAEYAPTSAPILGAYAYAAVQAWVMRTEPELLPRATLALTRGLAAGHGEAYLASAQHRLNTGEFERAGADLATALVRAPMSAQAHELAGKILLEIEGTDQARHHFETACGLDPGRSQIIALDLARLEAYEDNWDRADAHVAALVADPDTSLQQLGALGTARLSGWRRDRVRMMETIAPFLERMGPVTSAMYKLIGSVGDDGAFDRARWQQFIALPLEPGRPIRGVLVRLQLLCEIAMMIGDEALGLEALERLAELGLIDITWMDRCPLFETLAHRRPYVAVRRRVGERAARVLAAFRSIATAG